MEHWTKEWFNHLHQSSEFRSYYCTGPGNKSGHGIDNFGPAHEPDEIPPLDIEHDVYVM